MGCYFKTAMSVPTVCGFEKRQRKDMILPAAATASTFLSRRARRGADESVKTLPRRWKPLAIKVRLLPGAACLIRRLTPRECWRLQGFTDEMFDKARAVNSDNQLYRQAGNSVTVPVIYAIGKQILAAQKALECGE